MQIKILEKEDMRSKSFHLVLEHKNFSFQARAISVYNPKHFESTQAHTGLICFYARKGKGAKFCVGHCPPVTHQSCCRDRLLHRAGGTPQWASGWTWLWCRGGLEKNTAEWLYPRKRITFIWQASVPPPLLWGHQEPVLALRESHTLSHCGRCCSCCHLIATSYVINKLIIWGQRHFSAFCIGVGHWLVFIQTSDSRKYKAWTTWPSYKINEKLSFHCQSRRY